MCHSDIYIKKIVVSGMFCHKKFKLPTLKFCSFPLITKNLKNIQISKYCPFKSLITRHNTTPTSVKRPCFCAGGFTFPHHLYI